MLYVYNFIDYYGEEAVKAEDMQGLKPFGFEDIYLANTDKIVIEGKSPRITPLHEFIYNGGYFGCCDVLELDIALLDRKMEISKERAIELICDDLRIDGSYQYNNRIWNTENPAEEVATIIDELTVVVIGMIIDELNDKYNELKNKKSGFEWL